MPFNVSSESTPAMTEYSLVHFNSTLLYFDVKEVIIGWCSNSPSSPDSISFWLIKTIAASILHLLTIIYQHSVYDATFSSVWKDTIVIALYKGCDNCDSAASYRPTSLCHCLGKILKKIEHKLLNSHLSENQLLHPAQHGFTQRFLTRTNLLKFNALITKIISAGHLYNIILLDF